MAEGVEGERWQLWSKDEERDPLSAYLNMIEVTLAFPRVSYIRCEQVGEDLYRGLVMEVSTVNNLTKSVLQGKLDIVF